MFAVIILALLSLTDAAIYKDGPCPTVEPVKNFNLEAYASGVWYELAKYPNDFENKGDCTYVAYKNEDGVIKFQVGEVAEKHFESFDGTVEFAPGAGTSALLNHNSYNFNDKEKTTMMPVYILAIDYNKYYISYECRYDEAKKQRHEYAWVLSRTMTLDADSKAAVDNFLKISPLIQVDKFIWDKFDAQTCES